MHQNYSNEGTDNVLNHPASDGERDKWTSGFGFIMSAAGSAVGLGNIWKFPYICGTNGGALFLIFYILFVFLLGYPILLTELSIGRNGGCNAVDACRKIQPKWGFAGAFGVAGAIAVLSYYCIVGGWVLKYVFECASGSVPAPSFFSEYSTSSAEPVIWMAVFLIITAVIVMFGVSKGIEKVSSALLPLLLLMLICLMIYSLSLPNASVGVKFFLWPDFSEINSFADIIRIMIKALGQVFFSLSLGMGTLITYGSYLDKQSNLSNSTVAVVTIDTVIAVISGLTILPAVFSFGFKPDEGPGLIFSTLTGVFGNIFVGPLLGTVFFLLVLFAAITSSISLLEVASAFLIERFGFSRRTAVAAPILIIFILAVPASLSYGALNDFRILGMTVFDFYVFISDQIIMPLGGLFLCILAGWRWSRSNLHKEITSDGLYKFHIMPLFIILIRFAAPLVIIILFVSSLIT